MEREKQMHLRAGPEWADVVSKKVGREPQQEVTRLHTLRKEDG